MPAVTLQQAFEFALQHHQAGRLGEAEAIYVQILAVQPDHAESLNLLGVIAQQAGQGDRAVDLMRRGVQIRPDVAAFHFNLGFAWQMRGDLEDAITAYRRACQLDPSVAKHHGNLGCALWNAGRLDEAIEASRRAIQCAPEFVEAHNNLGNALRDKGHLDEAVSAYREALRLRPDSAEIHSNLGTALKDQGGLDEAVSAYREALRLRPDSAEIHSNLGTALKDQGRLDEAIGACRRAVEISPDYAVGYNNLANALKDAGLNSDAVAAFRRAVHCKPDHAEAHSNLLLTMHYLPGCDGESLLAEHRRWEEAHGRPLEKFILPHGNARDPARRLRIGYVSRDFRQGVIAQFLTPLLEAHDHMACEIFCYSSVKRPDAITARLRNASDGWRDVSCVSDEALAQRIRDDGIDILVDLTQHVAHNRLLVFARKPAPVQVAWLGYPGSTGLKAMDFRLTDGWMEPEGSEWSESVEKAVRLPDSWFCFDPLDEYPAPGGLPAVRAGHVTFGSLNNFCKVNDGVLERWAAVMRAVPGARLLMQCPPGETQARVRVFFQGRGIEPGRLELVWRLPRAEFLALFARMDIALDPFPYNGGTTTCEALWMGIPVLTLPGKVTVSRIGLSILMACGMEGFVAQSEEEYVRLAAGLAGDLPRLAHLRATLRGRMKASAFMDAPRFARNFEHALREMWRAWCSGPCSTRKA